MAMQFVQHRRAEAPDLLTAAAQQGQMAQQAHQWLNQFNRDSHWGQYDRLKANIFDKYDRQYQQQADQNELAMRRYEAEQEAAAARAGSFMGGIAKLGGAALGGPFGAKAASFLFGDE